MPLESYTQKETALQQNKSVIKEGSESIASGQFKNC